MGLVWCGCERAVILKDLVDSQRSAGGTFRARKSGSLRMSFRPVLFPKILHQRRLAAELLLVNLVADRFGWRHQSCAAKMGMRPKVSIEILT
jgi:hypothetical protein